MRIEKVTIMNPTGLHLRPAGVLCNEMIKFRCSVKFHFGDSVNNAKSVLSVLGACVKCGDELTFVCDGPDEDAAMEKILALAGNKFGEE